MKQLSDQQKAAITAPKDKPCVVVAVAGAGKTTVLEQRVKLLLKHKFDKQLIITFTKKAAKNLVNRVGEIPDTIFVGTFHSFCYKVLKEFAPEMIRGKFLTEQNSFKIELYAAQIIKSKGLLLDAKDAEGHISSLFKDGHTPDVWVKKSDKKALAHICEEVYGKLAREGFMFFEELALNVSGLLRESEDVVQQLVERYPIVKVDEFQDTDLVQIAILKTLSDAGSHLYAVGDTSQSIYTWRGCAPETIEKFEEIFGDSTRVVLDTNYRSNDAILANANVVLKELGASTRMVGIKGSAKSPITITQYEDAAEEAERVVERIKNDYNPRDCAILYRTNSQSGFFQNALGKAKIPFCVSGSVQSFFDMPEIKMLVSYAKIYCEPSDVDSLRYIWNRPNRFLKTDWMLAAVAEAKSHDAEAITREVLRRKKLHVGQKREVRYLADLLAAFKKGVPFKDLSKKLVDVSKKRGYYKSLVERSSTRNVIDVERAVGQMLKIIDEYPHPKALLDHIEYTKQLQEETQVGNSGVTLSTIHSAKGLEFPVVFLIGVEKEIMPHKGMFSEAEERRLMYVGVTRAEDELHISHYKQPSPFLKNLVAERYVKDKTSV